MNIHIKGANSVNILTLKHVKVPIITAYVIFCRHREQRMSMKEERKERKMQKRKKKISRFPKKPEVLVREHALEKRRVSSNNSAATRENWSWGVSTRPDTNRPVQSQKMARSLKFRF